MQKENYDTKMTIHHCNGCLLYRDVVLCDSEWTETCITVEILGEG